MCPTAPIVAVSVSAAYGSRVALDQVTLRVRSGEVHGLLGRNGAGKSTLFSVLAGVRAPACGSVRIASLSMIQEPRAAKSHLGFVPQEVAVYPLLTPRQNLASMARFYRIRQPKAAVQRVLRQMGLESRADDATIELSGGTQRKLAIGMSLIHDPAVLLLDEPTVGVDSATRTIILDTIRKAADTGAAVLTASHHTHEIERICDRVTILHDGCVRYQGSLSSVIESHGRGTVEIGCPGIDEHRREIMPLLESLPSVNSLYGFKSRIRASSCDPVRAARELSDALLTAGLSADYLQVTPAGLESAFLSLTESQTQT